MFETARLSLKGMSAVVLRSQTMQPCARHGVHVSQAHAKLASACLMACGSLSGACAARSRLPCARALHSARPPPSQVPADGAGLRGSVADVGRGRQRGQRGLGLLRQPVQARHKLLAPGGAQGVYDRVFNMVESVERLLRPAASVNAQQGKRMHTGNTPSCSHTTKFSLCTPRAYPNRAPGGGRASPMHPQLLRSPRRGRQAYAWAHTPALVPPPMACTAARTCIDACVTATPRVNAFNFS